MASCQHTQATVQVKGVGPGSSSDLVSSKPRTRQSVYWSESQSSAASLVREVVYGKVIGSAVSHPDFSIHRHHISTFHAHPGGRSQHV